MGPRILVAIAIAVALAAPARGDDREALAGTVTDHAGEPLDGVFLMVFEGDKIAPPFMVRPKAFGLPLPNVKVVTADEKGRFRFDRVKPGPKTIVIGEEGLLLFGVAAVRRFDFQGEAVDFELTADEIDAYYTLADRAEESTEVIENVLVEVDMALGWYVETRRKVREVRAEIRAQLGLDEDDEDDEEDEEEGDADGEPKDADEDLSSAWSRLRRRLEGLMDRDQAD